MVNETKFQPSSDKESNLLPYRTNRKFVRLDTCSKLPLLQDVTKSDIHIRNMKFHCVLTRSNYNLQIRIYQSKRRKLFAAACFKFSKLELVEGDIESSY
jgi:hypothetical protein